MSARVTIIANDVALDVFQDFDEKFWVTRVVHDLKSLETRNASYTKSFIIPSTASNIVALGPSLSLFNIPNQTGIKKVPCRVLMDGITVLSRGELIIAGVTGKYIALELSIFWGNFDFFESLRTILINEVDYSDLDMTWDITGITAIAENTSGIVFCKDEWVDTEALNDLGLSLTLITRTYQEIRLNGFWIYAREVLERLVINAGYTMDDSAVTWDRWSTIALACSAHKWVEIEAKVGAYTGNVTKSTNTTHTDTNQVIAVPFDGVVTDPDGQWTGASLYEWLIDNGGETSRTIVFKATLNMIHTQKNPTTTPYVAIRLNGVNVATHNFTGDETAVIVLEVELTVVDTDEIDCVDFASDGSGTNGSTNTILASGSIFEMNEIAGIDPDDSLEVAKYIPQIEAEKFVVSVCNMANVIIFADEANKIVRFISFDGILNSEFQDLSEKLAINKDIKSTNTIPTYFQNNEFKYGTVGNLVRGDVNGSYFFNDELLSARGTIIQLDFDACDNSVWVNNDSCSGSFYKKERVSLVGVSVVAGQSTFTTTDIEEWNIGDYIEIATSGSWPEVMRITGKTSDTIGTINGDWRDSIAGATQPYFIHKHKHGDFELARIANIEQTPQSTTLADGILNGDSPSTINTFTAQFDSDMSFQSLIAGEYSRLLNTLEKPLIITAWFVLTTREYVFLQQSRLAYINHFDSVFYINRIEQFKVGKPVRMELIRARPLSIGTKSDIIFDGTKYGLMGYHAEFEVQNFEYEWEGTDETGSGRKFGVNFNDAPSAFNPSGHQLYDDATFRYYYDNAGTKTALTKVSTEAPISLDVNHYIKIRKYGTTFEFTVDTVTDSITLTETIIFDNTDANTIIGCRWLGGSPSNLFTGTMKYCKFKELDGSGNIVNDLINIQASNDTGSGVPNIAADAPASSDLIWFNI